MVSGVDRKAVGDPSHDKYSLVTTMNVDQQKYGPLCGRNSKGYDRYYTRVARFICKHIVAKIFMVSDVTPSS